MRRARLVLLVLFLLQVSLLFGQPTPPPPGDPGGGGNPTPISGVEILLVAGGILGIKKLVSKKEKGR